MLYTKMLQQITINENQIYILKIFFISVFSYYTMRKITLQNINNKVKNIICILFLITCSIVNFYIKQKTNKLIEISALICELSLLFSILNKNNLGYSMLVAIISTSLNYIIFIISVFVIYVLNILLETNNKISLLLIELLHAIILYGILKIKKIKYGITFLRKDKQNSYFDLLVLNISSCILFITIMIPNLEFLISRSFFAVFVIISIIMFITIQKSLQLYYKQKMLIKDLTETKEELENKKKEIEELEAENIRISKKNHTIVHKQKSIEHKLEEMLIKSEISIEEAGEVKERLEKLHTQIYSEKENTELDKTGITNIDDMLNYMQSECTKNKIEFTLVIKGNIHYMVNNLISKEDLETLIADHIKDAIIAINHTDNINRSILVKLGNIDGIYSLYIYDSGVEFKKEVLENLGIKPFTTYENEGGTGMGFMNTFDTLRKCKASLIIEEFNEPKPDNYTKLIAIKFDNNNKFEIKSYRKIEIKKKI